MYYQDDFSKTFHEERDLHNFLYEVGEREWWKRTKSVELEVLPCDGQHGVEPVDGENTDCVMMDTMKNSQLLVKTFGKTFMLGATAIPTLCRRARISGNALSDVDKPVLADILNGCLHVAQGMALVHFYEGKVRSIHSEDYAILNMQDIFMTASAYINAFDNVGFLGGFTDHTLTSAIWIVSDERMLSAYRDLMREYGKEASSRLAAMIRITTSDVAASGVNISYSVSDNGSMIVLGKNLKTIHRGSGKKAASRFEEVEENLCSIFEFYKETMRDIKRLLEIRIKYPVNTMRGIMSSVGISKKLTAEAVEKFMMENGDMPCTAYDVYCAICQILAFAKAKGAGERELIDLEEDIAKCSAKRWKDYDMPDINRMVSKIGKAA